MKPPMLKVARVWTLAVALCLVAIGLLFGSLGALTSFLQAAPNQLMMVTLSVSFSALTVGLGSMLAWQAWQSILGQASRPFRPRRGWVLGLLFLLVVLTGQLVLKLELLPQAAFPLLHVAAAVLPALAIVALVGRSLEGTSRWRDVVLQISSGAFLSTSLAFALEFAFVLGPLIAVITVVALQPGGLEEVQALANRLQDPAWLQDPTNLAPLARSPIVLGAAFLVFGIVIPLVEEAVKTVGVGLMAYRRPALSQAFLWGLAGGAGFAMAEGLFNSLGSLDAWAMVVLLRVGATLLHCFTGALMGLAWYCVLAERRWGRGLGLWAVSVGTHSLWNTLAAGLATLSLATLSGEGTQSSQVPSPGVAWGPAPLILAAAVVLLGALVLAMGLGLAGLTWYVRRTSAQSTLSPAATGQAVALSGHAPTTPAAPALTDAEEDYAPPDRERREIYP